MGALIGFSLTNMMTWDTSLNNKIKCLEEFAKFPGVWDFNERITDFTLNENDVNYRTYWNVKGHYMIEYRENLWNIKEKVINRYSIGEIPDFFSNLDIAPISISYDDWLGLDSINVFLPSNNVEVDRPNGESTFLKLQNIDYEIKINGIDWGINFLNNLKNDAKREAKNYYADLIKIFKFARKNKFLIIISDK